MLCDEIWLIFWWILGKINAKKTVVRLYQPFDDVF